MERGITGKKEHETKYAILFLPLYAVLHSLSKACGGVNSEGVVQYKAYNK